VTTDQRCEHCGCPECRHHPVSRHCPLPYGGFPDLLLHKESDYIRCTKFKANEDDDDPGRAEQDQGM
jgi:hypothetical protein